MADLTNDQFEATKRHLLSEPEDDILVADIRKAAQAHVERQLGYAFSTLTTVPDDLVHAVHMLAAHWYENREATLVGVTAQPLPFGVAEIINEHRNYTFGLADDD